MHQYPTARPCERHNTTWNVNFHIECHVKFCYPLAYSTIQICNGHTSSTLRNKHNTLKPIINRKHTLETLNHPGEGGIYNLGMLPQSITGGSKTPHTIVSCELQSISHSTRFLRKRLTACEPGLSGCPNYGCTW